MTHTVGVLREAEPGERRVALVPEVVPRLCAQGFDVVVQSGAGECCGFDDATFRAAGARIGSADAIASADVVVGIGAPDMDTVELHEGQVVLGLLDPLGQPERVAALAAAGVTALAFELLPRTLSRAQPADALSSQSSAAGYRAAIVAAEAYAQFLPMMSTAAGTFRPARVLVIGAGVAGLQALATARRLGAITFGYDVRPTSRAEVESVGATFVTSAVADARGVGGYARALTVDEHHRQADELADIVRHADVVITTAKVPGGRPPLLVNAGMLATMASGSVCIDLAVGPRGGNIEGARDGDRYRTANGVTVIGHHDLATELSVAASAMYARNVLAVLQMLTSEGELVVRDDDVIGPMIAVRDGRVRDGHCADLVTQEQPVVGARI
ncbi:hypothetical protein ATY41_11620 [Leifsonia xyli subsp. xyli]|uniref:proton-translocating NAD(P)(+) transhydrogenase n=2 Tax=Leifsonia xyli subsp. xyli TaxID=59736 RepID=Q6ACH0_LEIXX|nr:NAD(P) transhydrogenase subunit alpha [Leifsonia xyli]AAT89923.1 NADP-transhydrogenase [Leifsonia xyli subsp. xyli str. CTCB07]ODA90102.1 hypothetical protein ATY41_11620 [Leifsonia xyli subsp. xyli]